MKVKLPESFAERLRAQLGEEEFQEYLACFESSHQGGIRVNTLKLTTESFHSISPYDIENIPWIPNGFFHSDSDQPATHPYYYAGMYYLQEPSAMTPASLLPVVPGDKVLDICAAPGGKSTELGARLCGEGVLISNDISNSRAKALLKNVELFGIRNAIVMSEAPGKLVEKFSEYFDKILVDAPCSGEGMFRKSPVIMKNWEQYGTGYYNELQKQILNDVVKMLKPGGYLLYSTCTFSPMEDEETVMYVLNQFPDFELADAIPNPVPNGLSYEGMEAGRPEWAKNGSPDLTKTIRLWPHKIRGEGHFVALFHKKENSDTNGIPWQPEIVKKAKLSEEAAEFLTHLKTDIPKERIVEREERLYLLPDGIPSLSGLRILRSGLLLGEIKKNRFEPSQALACALKREEYDNVYSLSSEDEDVIRYLKCESIEIKDKNVKDGYVLICVDGYPLGWGKYNKGNFKNKYLPGWRMM